MIKPDDSKEKYVYDFRIIYPDEKYLATWVKFLRSLEEEL